MSEFDSLKSEYIANYAKRAAAAKAEVPDLLKADNLDGAKAKIDEAVLSKKVAGEAGSLIDVFTPELQRFVQSLRELNQGLTGIGAEPISFESLFRYTGVEETSVEPPVFHPQPPIEEPLDATEVIVKPAVTEPVATEMKTRKASEIYHVDLGNGVVVETKGFQVKTFLEVVRDAGNENPMLTSMIDEEVKKVVPDSRTHVSVMRANANQIIEKVGLTIASIKLTDQITGKPRTHYYIEEKKIGESPQEPEAASKTASKPLPIPEGEKEKKYTSLQL